MVCLHGEGHRGYCRAELVAGEGRGRAGPGPPRGQWSGPAGSPAAGSVAWERALRGIQHTRPRGEFPENLDQDTPPRPRAAPRERVGTQREP